MPKISSNWKKLQKKLKNETKSKGAGNSNEQAVVVEPITPKPSNYETKIGKYVAMDCEMVGVGKEGKLSVLARVSVVNWSGHVIYDEYVKPLERITDFRTNVSGITPQLLHERGKEFKIVQKEISDILKDKIVVGHALKNDFDALMLDHPKKLVRDTSKYKALLNEKSNRPQSLKKLAKELLSKDIQSGQHSSVEDARAALEIFKIHKQEWEKSLFRKEKILRPHSW